MSQLDILSHFINGEHVNAQSGRFADVYNPALGVPIAQVALATKDEVDAAVAAACAAFASWSTTPPLRRARVLFKYLQLCQQHIDEFATMLTREHGKTFLDAQGEVARGIEMVEFAVGIPQLLKGGVYRPDITRDRCLVDAPGTWCGRRDHAV